MLFILCLPINIAAESSGYDKDVFNRAKLVTESVIKDSLFASRPEAYITRAEFISAIVKVFKMDEVMGYSSFEDIENNPHYDAVNTAVALNWITDSDKFFPNRNIKVEEAIKILICATGYDYLAEHHGGYPYGFLTIANNHRLLGRVVSGANNEITTENGTILIYNMLNMNALKIASYGDEIRYEQKSGNYLEEIYNIQMVSGIITSTTYNSFSFGHKITKNGLIEINGKSFSYGEMKADMLGKNVYAYFEDSKDDIKNIVFLIPERNEETVITSEDFVSVKDNVISYYDADSSRVRTLSLSEVYMTIYNGRRTENTKHEIFDNLSGKIRLLDNNGDSIYDVVFVDGFEYMQITSVDFNSESIGGKYSGGNYLELNTDGGFYQIFTSDGKELMLFELRPDDLIAIKVSHDGLLTEIILCEGRVSGTIDSINLEDGFIYIDDKEYKLSNYFLENYANIVMPGNREILYLGLDEVIVNRGFFVTDLRFGYLMQTAMENNLSKSVKMKILTDRSEMKVFDVSDKVFMNGGERRISSAEVYKYLCVDNAFERQLIRYSIDSRGSISKIYFAKEKPDVPFDEELQKEDEFIKYSYASQLLYRSNIRAFPPNFNVVSTVIFKIPFDADNEDNYEVVSALALSDASRYNVTAYNIGIDGGAKAAVVQETEEITLTYHNDSFIIETINSAINSDGEYGRKLYGWSPGGFTEYFLSDKIVARKTSGNPLASGDVVRIKYDRQKEINEIVVDFDASDGVFAGNESAGGAPINGGNQNITYQIGKVYSLGNSFVYLSNTKDDYGKFNFSFENLKNYNISTPNIIRYDMESGKLRTIKADEIKTFLSYGEKASYILVRQRAFAPVCIFVYE